MIFQGNIFINGEVSFVNSENTKCIGGNIFNKSLVFGTGIKNLDINNNIFDNCPPLEIRDFINGFHIDKNHYISSWISIIYFNLLKSDFHPQFDIIFLYKPFNAFLGSIPNSSVNNSINEL